MALNLEGATIGYDPAGLKQLKENIKVECIDFAAKEVLKLDNINTTVDEAWQGDAADRFKKRFKDDAENISSVLKNLGQQIEDDLENTGKGMNTVDSNIIV